MVHAMADVVKQLQVESGVTDEQILGAGIGVPDHWMQLQVNSHVRLTCRGWHDFEVAAGNEKTL